MNNLINSGNNDIQEATSYPNAAKVHNEHTIINNAPIGSIGNLNLNITAEDLVKLLSSIQNNPGKTIRTKISTNIDICRDYYNLVVQGFDGDFDCPFLFDPKRALTEGMKESLKNQFSTLEPAAIRILYTFPTLFATENHAYGHTDEDHEIGFGFIKQIKVLPAGIKIYPNILFTFPQQRCNENVVDLGFYGDERGNELNRTHWTIKQLDLIEELRIMGYSEKLEEVGL